MKDREWITIPVLKYIDIPTTLNFWETLGFKITYRQDRLYKYAVVERNGGHLHFYYNKSIEALTPSNGCLMIVNDIQNNYQEFVSGLKKSLGRVPTSGLPRISRMKPMGTRFTVTDPSGNSIIFIQRGDKDKADYESLDQQDLSEFEKLIALATRLRDFKEDYAAAAKTLDNALKKAGTEVSKDQIAAALRMKTELANILNESK